MTEDQNICIIAGSGRNVGKTELVCQIIHQISNKQKIWGLKVSAIYPDEGIYHGNHDSNEEQGSLVEETRDDTHKDTSRMLRAGAEKVYYLRAEDHDLLNGFNQFRKIVPDDVAIICESNSLGGFLQPGLLLLVVGQNLPIKERAKTLRKIADLEIISDGKSGFPELARIGFVAGGWKLA